MRYTLYIMVCVLCFSCSKQPEERAKQSQEPFILVLGVAQDAGYPQIACQKECCNSVYKNSDAQRLVSSIALVDPTSNKSWIFDATPDFTKQTQILSRYLDDKVLPDGIFLTHGHVGHYTGLMYLGREAMSAERMPVYAMPRMENFLKTNGPWSQLITLNNIELKSIEKDTKHVLNKHISVTPIEVPHRDEFTETVGFFMNVKDKKALFIPDIDKWSKWDRSIIEYIKKVDLALLDATFFKAGELKRDMNEVPHPFVEESMSLFKNLSPQDRKKIYFIHFNHTNPLLIEGGKAQKEVEAEGFNIAIQGQTIELNESLE